VAEGFYTVAALVAQARKLGVDLPITEAVYRILYENVSPTQAVDELFARELKSEVSPEIFWGQEEKD
jgi:glycerol-3-phosphate dehydrogenase (NAD(P)+)